MIKLDFNSRYIGIILLLILPFSTIYSQNIDSCHWRIGVLGGIAEHDKRLGSWSPGQRLLEEQPEKIGTYQARVFLSRFLSVRDNVKLSLGMVAGYQRQTFRRPFEDASVPDDVITSDVFEWSDDYRELTLGPSTSLFYSPVKNLSVSGDVNVNFRYFVEVRDDKNIRQLHGGPRQIRIHSVEFISGIHYCLLKRVSVFGNYRVAQLLHNDPNQLNSITHSVINGDDPPADFEWFNPFSLQFGVSFDW